MVIEWMVGIAQLVEHQVVVLRVVGSIPTAHPRIPLKFLSHFCRGVAQLVAHSLWERGVVSSSLATPTIFLYFAVIFLKHDKLLIPIHKIFFGSVP